jgi:putative ABC transport system permease protein
MGIPLRAGRFFTDQDGKGAEPVVIVDETFAQRYFPGENPIGKHIKGEFSGGEGKSPWQIIGVVGGAKYWVLSKDPFPHMYFSYLQENWGSMALVVRAQSRDPMTLAAPIRAELAAIDKYQPIHSFKPLEATVSELSAPERFTTMLLTAFAILAAGLAAIGIYGVISYTVTWQTRELGVRLALGAQPKDVLRLILGQGVRLTVIGSVIGLAGAFALTRVMSSLLYGVSATDPMTFVVAALALSVVALAACYIPARRVTKIDPMIALRCE